MSLHVLLPDFSFVFLCSGFVGITPTELRGGTDAKDTLFIMLSIYFLKPTEAELNDNICS